MKKKEHKYRISVRTKVVLLVMLVCLVVSIAGAGRAVAAVNRNSYLLGTDAANSALVFDPFNPNASTSGLFGGLASTTISTSTSTTSTTSRPPIRVPYRPALRSPYRPPL